MEKAQLPLLAELDLGGTKDNTPKTVGTFAGTDNPRYLRVLQVLLTRPRTREELDRIAGASNSPELIAELRRKGLCIPCHRTPGVDRDGRAIKFGTYWLTDADRRALYSWMRSRGVRTVS